MIASSPGRGETRNSLNRLSLGTDLLLHLAGSILGASFLVFALQLSNHLMGLPREAAVVVAIAAACCTVLRFRVPHSRWMVPKSWARYGREPYAFLFAFVLGTALLTAVPGFGMYAVAVFVAVMPFEAALAVGLAFGIARGAAPLIEALAVGRMDGWHAAEAATLRAQFALSLELPALLAAAAVMLITFKP
jgi:hypothetical protein